jgi:hypothetical protein
MSVTPARVAQTPEYLQQIEKLVNSSTLHGSESLCKLLRYLAQHALEHPGVPLKEYQIATEVFGRPVDFDPHLDSTIRVQAGRLRIKLADYYAAEGTDDPIIVELPKGTYLLTFRSKANHRQAATEKVHRLATVSAPAKPVTVEKHTDRQLMTLGLLTFSAFVVGCLLMWYVGRTTASVSLVSKAPTQMQTFWQNFIFGPEDPWVVFSNGAFIGRPETGMRYFDPGHDKAEKILDHYTGVGEVLAVHELDRVFHLLHRDIRVKRGSMLSLDDAKNNNLIFIGSPAENPSLLELPGSREFVFKRVASGSRKGDLGVLNVHPNKGEPDMFLATSGPPLTEDYEVIALVNGLTQGLHTLILAGTTTLGTEAAAEYVSRPDSLQELLSRLGVRSAGELKPFEAVLRTKVTRGVPVETQLVALRKTAP